MCLKLFFSAVFMSTLLCNVQAGAATCLTGGCHQALTSQKYVHGPIAAEQAGAKGCVACHIPAGKKCTQAKAGSFKPLAQPDKMCRICHSRGNGSQHSAKKINCLKCHDPHGSDKGPELKR